MLAQATRLLQQYWGYPAFRDAQIPIVEAVLSGRDVLAVLPTGGGKSLTFQVPALVSGGTTLVVTPLVALMEDQVARLQSLGIKASCLHGQQPAALRAQVLKSLPTGHWQLLYLSPETLLSPPVWSRLPSLSIARIVLDEAHCLTSWGSSFRPAYHRLGAVRSALGRPPLVALTATAPPPVLARLERLLGLDDPVRLVSPPYRPNLFLQVRWMFTPRQRLRAILDFLAKQSGSGLIYLRTRSGCETLATQLARSGHAVAFYHAGLTGPERRRIEKDWLAGKLRFLTCSNAFGMGVDAPHVRWVIHASTPPSLEEYLQEIGRAGRDGAPATVLLLASEPTGLLEPTDRLLHQHFAAGQQQHWRKAQAAARQLPPAGPWQPELDLSLALLHEAGKLSWQTPFCYRLLPGAGNTVAIAGEQGIRGYLWTRRCRWQYLLAAFGFPDQRPCGHCDRCKCSSDAQGVSWVQSVSS